MEASIDVLGPDQTPLAEARALGVVLGNNTILHDIALSVRPGEIVTVIGPNGSGKTTLIRSLIGLLPATEGSVSLKSGITVGYVPQRLEIDPTFPLTVERFLKMAGDDTAAALAEVGAGGLGKSAIQELSGGELKRVMLARALLKDPDLLVLDEPTANVDVSGQTAFYDLIRDIRDRRGCGILLVSHDLHMVMAATDTVICLNGHICCSGTPDHVSVHPEYIALFGEKTAETLAVYSHHHDHDHDMPGLPADDAH